MLMRSVEWNQRHGGGPAELLPMAPHGAPRGLFGVWVTFPFGQSPQGSLGAPEPQDRVPVSGRSCGPAIDPFQPIDTLRSCRTTGPDPSRSASTKLPFVAYGGRPVPGTGGGPVWSRARSRARAAGESPTMAATSWALRCTCVSTTSPMSTLASCTDHLREKQRTHGERIYALSLEVTRVVQQHVEWRCLFQPGIEQIVNDVLQRRLSFQYLDARLPPWTTLHCSGPNRRRSTYPTPGSCSNERSHLYRRRPRHLPTVARPSERGEQHPEVAGGLFDAVFYRLLRFLERPIPAMPSPTSARVVGAGTADVAR